MKILYFILSLYVLVLSISPCCEDNNCIDNDHLLKTEQSDNSQHDNDCKGNCSPFYTCNTCVGFIITKTNDNLTIIATFVVKNIILYNQQFVENYFAKIWQPPKIS